jgi:hypothetical protein
MWFYGSMAPLLGTTRSCLRLNSGPSGAAVTSSPALTPSRSPIYHSWHAMQEIAIIGESGEAVPVRLRLPGAPCREGLS